MSRVKLRPRPRERVSVPLFVADMGVAFLTLDEAGAVVDCDGSVEGMFGYAPRDLIFQPASKLIPRLQYDLSDRIAWRVRLGVRRR